MFFILKINEISKSDPSNGYVIYGEEYMHTLDSGNLVGRKAAGSLVTELEEKV